MYRVRKRSYLAWNVPWWLLAWIIHMCCLYNIVSAGKRTILTWYINFIIIIPGCATWLSGDSNWDMGSGKIPCTLYSIMHCHRHTSKVQCTIFLPITTQASISVIIISVLVIIVGVLVIAVVVGFALYVKFQKPSISNEEPILACNYQWYSSPISNVSMCIYLKSSQPIVLLSILAVILTALGIAAGALIPSVSDNCVVHCVYITIKLYQLSESITTSANISLFTT